MRRPLPVLALSATALLCWGAASAGAAPGHVGSGRRTSLHFGPNVTVYSGNYGEPGLAMDRSGRDIYVTTPGDGGAVFGRSTDGGRHFVKRPTVRPPGGSLESQTSGSDSDVVVAPNGDVLTADLNLSPSAIVVSRSSDRGSTFPQQTSIRTGTPADREWIATDGPTGAIVYVAYHDLASGTILAVRSTDGGKTFGPQMLLESQPTTIVQSAHNGTAIGSLSTDGHGGVYLNYGTTRLDTTDTTYGSPPISSVQIAVSRDYGVTWADHTVNAGAADANYGNFWMASAVDRAGDVYVTYSGYAHKGQRLAVWLQASKDHGVTWTAPLRVSLPAGNGLFGWVAGGGKDVADVAWYSTTSPDKDSPTAEWQVSVAQVRGLIAGHPVLYRGTASDHVMHIGGVCTLGIFCGVLPGSSANRTLLDFFKVAVDPAGMAEVVFSDNAVGGQVTFARQSGGPSAFAK